MKRTVRRRVSEDISATSTDEISTCIAPGILLACGVTAAAFLLRTLPGLALFSPMILAVAVGIAVSAIIGKRSRDVAGLRFGQRSLLRIGIILLGFQLTWPQLTAIGGPAVIVIALSLAASSYSQSFSDGYCVSTVNSVS